MDLSLPRSYADEEALRQQRNRLRHPHVAPLTDLALGIEGTTGESVPRFDPAGAGVAAEVLILLESPGPRSTADSGSGFISPHNDDPSAQHLHELLTTSGVGIDRALCWNAVPWWLSSRPGAEGSFRAPTVGEIDAAHPWLVELVHRLPSLEVIITMGRVAERGLARERTGALDRFHRVSCPHPGQQSWNRSAYRLAMFEAFAAVEPLLDEAHSPPRKLAFWPVT